MLGRFLRGFGFPASPKTYSEVITLKRVVTCRNLVFVSHQRPSNYEKYHLQQLSSFHCSLNEKRKFGTFDDHYQSGDDGDDDVSDLGSGDKFQRRTKNKKLKEKRIRAKTSQEEEMLKIHQEKKMKIIKIDEADAANLLGYEDGLDEDGTGPSAANDEDADDIDADIDSGDSFDGLMGRKNMDFEKKKKLKNLPYIAHGEHKLNDKIPYKTVKLVKRRNRQEIGIFPINDALRMAKGEQGDLILIDERENPPVCIIYDYALFAVKKNADAKEHSKKRRLHQEEQQRRAEPKMVKFRDKIQPYDLSIKIEKVLKFLNKGNAVKLELFSNNLEAAKPLFQQIMTQLKKEDPDIVQDHEPTLSSRSIICSVRRKKA